MRTATVVLRSYPGCSIVLKKRRSQSINKKGCSFDSFWISSVFFYDDEICDGGIIGVAHARKHFLTFEGKATDSEFYYIPRLLTLSCCHKKCSLDRERTQMTHFSLYNHNATQSECAHRLYSEWGLKDHIPAVKTRQGPTNEEKAEIEPGSKKEHLQQNWFVYVWSMTYSKQIR